MKPLSTFLKIPDPFLNTLPNILINITLYYRILLSIGFAVFLGLVFFIKSTDAETIKVSSDFGYNYANLNSSNAKVAEGRLFFQNEDALVFQFDGLYADVSGLDFKGLGAHYYFYHDTNSMLGISGSRLSGDLVNSGEIAFEGTYNLSKFTLGSKLGYASIKYKQSAPFIDTDLKKAFAMIYLKSIIKETLMVNIAYERRFDLNALSLEAEYFSPINNVSFFTHLQTASNDYDHATLGIRYHFDGSSKNLPKASSASLKKKAFSNRVKDTLFGVGNYGALYNKKGNRYAQENNLNTNFNDFGLSIELIGGPNEAYPVGPDEIN